MPSAKECRVLKLEQKFHCFADASCKSFSVLCYSASEKELCEEKNSGKRQVLRSLGSLEAREDIKTSSDVVSVVRVSERFSSK